MLKHAKKAVITLTLSLNNPVIMRQVIMDHYKNPRNHGLIDNQNYKNINLSSESCIDNIDLQVLFMENKIADFRFDGVACTISTAATSILGELVKGKTFEEALVIINNYSNMINMLEYDEEILEEAVVLKNVSVQPSRIKCATISYNGLYDLIIKEIGEQNG